MKPNVHPITPLSRALPQVDRMTNRLRRCVAMARTAGHRWGSAAAGQTGVVMDSPPGARVAPDALIAMVHTPFGIARLAIAPVQWPALASAAMLPDAGQRRAVAVLLAASRLGRLADLVSDIELRPGDAGDAVSSGVALQLEATRLDVVGLDERLLAALEAQVGVLAPRLSAEAGNRRLASRILLGSRTLPLRRLRALRVGDVVILASGTPAEPGVEAWLSWGCGSGAGLRTRVILSGAHMSLTDIPAITGTDADAGAGADENPGGAEISLPSGGDRLARIEMPVGIELSGPTLRLADIADLKAGDVLELPVPIEQAQVRITVAGQGWGIGELVAVGGRLGVRILRMNDAAGGAP